MQKWLAVSLSLLWLAVAAMLCSRCYGSLSLLALTSSYLSSPKSEKN
jgi:hypothetical protein